jgi:hypothetical protein
MDGFGDVFLARSSFANQNDSAVRWRRPLSETDTRLSGGSNDQAYTLPLGLSRSPIRFDFELDLNLAAFDPKRQIRVRNGYPIDNPDVLSKSNYVAVR